MAHHRVHRISLLAATLIAVTGCESRDERLAEYAQQATEQQAHQNEQMARQSQQVVQHSGELAKAAHNLVEQDAQARREFIQAQERAQRDAREEHARLDVQRQELHAERKEVAAAAIREPVIAQALITTGLILATLLPLIVTAYALRRLPDSTASETLLSTALLEDLIPVPIGLPRPGEPSTRLQDGPAPRLPGPATSAEPGVSSGEASAN